MKTISTLLLVLAVEVSTHGQETGVQPLLNKYIQLKDALVESNAQLAAAHGKTLSETISLVDATRLQVNERKEFMAEKNLLLKMALKISKTNDIEQQRTAFTELSVSLWKVVVAAEGVNGQVFYQYCPMKKAYWLSTEAVIKNPYYGAKMLSCGKVSAKKVK